MAPKQALYHEDPPADSSSFVEEEASDEETSGSKGDEQEQNVKRKHETPPKAKKPQPKPSANASRQSTKLTKRRHSNVENGDSEDEEPERKKSGGNHSKKALFQRVWSEDDEITILKGMIDFAAKMGADPAVADMNEFHDFIKKSLQIRASKKQLSDKVRRLKKRYFSSLKNKINPTKPHEMAALKLSKRIWGSGEPHSNGATNSGQKVKLEVLSSAVAPSAIEMAEIDPKAGASASVSGLIGSDKSLPEYMVTHGLDMISESKKAEWLAKWEELRLAEFDLLLEKNKLISKETELILDAFTSSNQ